MDRRSWYMPKESADAQAAAPEDLHWSTRQSKHALMVTLVDAALAYMDEIQERGSSRTFRTPCDIGTSTAR
ncbi:hypothetical protein [Streptomyces sp. NBC_01176]|uniref:hypothetical protein n=1 Tax=Streptomyces sp. NBC_01176 TaxID=2903760 RepID=UPI002F90AC2D|nr:hypothetical protein OG199_45600 [Streptomyces sp. NBC_01176]